MLPRLQLPAANHVFIISSFLRLASIPGGCLAVWAAMGLAALAQSPSSPNLPPESELLRPQHAVPLTTAPLTMQPTRSLKTTALPSEAVLAKGPPASIPNDSQTSNSGATNTPANSSQAIPGESMLPGQSQPQQPPSQPPRQGEASDDNEPPPAITDDMPGDQRPILRLNYNGPSGRVKTMCISGDGKRMICGGEDKDVHVWLRDPRDQKSWVHAKTIRWQVWRGPRGSIYDLDSQGDQVAMAGYGAMGGTGEIWIVNSVTGDLVRPLVDYSKAHRQAIDSVSWSGAGDDSLVSGDLLGRVVHWSANQETGQWAGTTIVQEDTDELGDVLAKQLSPFRRFHPVTYTGNQIATLKLDRMQPGDVPFPIWKIRLIDPQSPNPPRVLRESMPGVVTDLVSSRDGTYLAAACFSAREIKLWRFNNGVPGDAITLKTGGRPLFVAFDDSIGDGSAQRLLVGTEGNVANAQTATDSSLVKIYDLTSSPVAEMSTMTLAQVPAAGAFDVAGRSVVLAVGNSLQVHAMDQFGKLNQRPKQVLTSPLNPVLKVAASQSASPIRLAISRSRDPDGKKVFDEIFDFSAVSLEADPEPFADNPQFLSGQRLDAKITIRPAKNTPNRFDLYRDEALLGRLPLRPELHGNPTTVSTVRTETGQPLAIVGTEGQNGIYVFSASPPQPPASDQAAELADLKLLRYFRGHSGAVRSTSASANANYLFSGGDDAVICVWNLAGVTEASRSNNRWGAEFEISEGALLISSLDEAGPLYFRGARVGDRLQQLSWPDLRGKPIRANTAIEMAKALDTVPFDTQVVFDFLRQGSPIPTFQMFPAWYPLATMIADKQRHWAMWTPSGIYNASLEGHHKFGWQLNRGVNADVDFFRADQFQAILERPEVIRRLLRRGSLADAMRDAIGAVPPRAESALVNQIQSRPRIRLIEPTTSILPAGNSLTVVAQIDCPLGLRVSNHKAFIDGIPGTITSAKPVVVPDSSVKLHTVEVRWQFALPSQTEMHLEILAATDARALSRKTLVLQRAPNADGLEPKLPTKRPQLHVLAIGISQYSDPGIQSLDFPADATHQIAEALRRDAGGIYDVTSAQLVNEQATRPLWRIYAQSAVEQLREQVSPDDLVVMYLCGHGVRDRRTGKWYFVAANADFRDLMNDQYEDCLSFSDLSLFADLPCRKLAILDSCHSGAIQTEMREDDQKSVLRYLQDDFVFTMTASEGREEAAEVIEAGLGRFTSRLLQALRGDADQDGDGRVTFRETASYVVSTVSEDAAQDGQSQHPTLGPSESWNRLEVPFTTKRPKVASRP